MTMHDKARNDTLAGDALLRSIAAQFASGKLCSVAAIETLRAGGISEPEIAEALRLGLASHVTRQ